MANLEKRLTKLEQTARPNSGVGILVAVDGIDADEQERDDKILSRKLREAGISMQEFEAMGGKFLRVRFVEPKPR